MDVDGERQRHHIALLGTGHAALPLPAVEDDLRDQQDQPYRFQVSTLFFLYKGLHSQRSILSADTILDLRTDRKALYSGFDPFCDTIHSF